MTASQDVVYVFVGECMCVCGNVCQKFIGKEPGEREGGVYNFLCEPEWK